jgi:hypothetical protein
VLGLVSTNVSAAGNPPCSKRDDVLAQLDKKYKELPAAFGLANNGGLIEVLTSDPVFDSNGDGIPDTTKTWTIIVSMPNGTSCLLAAGENWQPIEWEAYKPPAEPTEERQAPGHRDR